MASASKKPVAFEICLSLNEKQAQALRTFVGKSKGNTKTGTQHDYIREIRNALDGIGFNYQPGQIREDGRWVA